MKSMYKFVLLLYVLMFCNPVVFAAIASGTVVKISADELVPIEKIVVGNSLIGCTADKFLVEAEVIGKQRKRIDSVRAITTHKGTFYVSQEQLFYDPGLNKWIQAKDLTQDSIFMDSEFKSCPCLGVETVSTQKIAYELSLQSPHVFFVSDAQILTHNIPPLLITIAFTFGSTLSSIELAEITAAVGALAMGLYKALADEPVNTIDIHTSQFGVKDKEDKLPKGGEEPFIPKKTKDGKILRDHEGGFIDSRRRSWIWDPIKNEWDVQEGGVKHLNVNIYGMITH